MANNEKKGTGMVKSFLFFFMIALCGIGIIGSFGWMCYLGANNGNQVEGNSSAYVIAVGLIVAAFMVWPVVKEMWRRMGE